MRRPNLTRVAIALGAIRTRANANSPHPSFREGRLSASRQNSVLQTLLADGDFRSCLRRGDRPWLARRAAILILAMERDLMEEGFRDGRVSDSSSV
jgi:hypothetical protein